MIRKTTPFPQKLIASFGVIAAASAALAADETKPTTEDDGTLDTTVISGEKIERSYQQTYASVGVVGKDKLQRGNAQDLVDTMRYLANVTDADFIDSGIVIRGINSEGIGGPAGSTLATVYVDGVAQTRAGARRGALGTWDLKQINVFRGPQSTISGRNALAGAIHLETNDPTFFTEGALKAGFGNNGFYEGAAMVSGPINDYWAFRFSGSVQHRDGEIRYPNYGGFSRIDERRDDDSYDLRAKFLYQPEGEDGFSALFSFSHSYDSPMYRDVDGASAGVGYYDRVWGLQSVPVFDEARSTKVTQGSVKLKLPVNDRLRLESISGFVLTDTNRDSVNRASRGAIEEREYSQEIRAVYKTDTLEAVGGVYYLDSHFDDDRYQQRPWEPFQRQDLAKGDAYNLAFFADGRWSFSPDWWLIGGIRYDYESQDFSSRNRRVGPTGTVISDSRNSSSANYDAVLPKVGLARDFGDSTLSFTVQRAYRAGGAAVDFMNNTSYTFDPEYAWNYEISWKGKALEGDLVYGLNLFYMDWKDQQINVPRIPNDFTSDIILNAGESTVYGGELEFQYRPTDQLRVFGSMGVSMTKFDDFAFVSGGSLVDLAGNSFPQSPDYTASVGFDYEFGNGMFCGADAKYTSSVVSRSVLEGLAEDDLPSYITVNAHVGYKFDDWTVTLWANNLFDEDYMTYRYDSPGFNVGTVGAERAYGVSCRYDF